MTPEGQITCEAQMTAEGLITRAALMTTKGIREIRVWWVLG